MKKLIFILMLCKGCVAFGQEFKPSNKITLPETKELEINYYNDEDGFLSDSMVRRIFTINSMPVYYDTILCLMLVTDTGFVSTNVILQESEIYSEQPLPFAYYLKGYEVMQDIYFHKEYLDADKHPLPKNVVVWMSKPTSF